jgi:hypothetical protein
MKSNQQFSALSKIAYSIVLTLLIGNLSAQQLAFPTAEGYGKFTTGGRGGKIIEVTTLNATGTGSLGAAISASGARTIVFRVSGTINGDFNIKNGDITIAGQTAPGDGICINGNLSTSANNIIIRYIRVRHDPSIVGDALGGRFQKNIIIDHVSTSWSADEVLTIYHNENTTVQWCIIAEACEKFEGGVSVGHRFGGIWGNNYGSWHHNLIAHNDSRNPRWASGCGFNDYRNNVIYNWGYESCYGGEKEQVNTPQFSSTTINMVANYYKPGPATIANKSALTHIANPSARSSTDKGDWYVSGNYFDGNSGITSDNWKGVVGSNYNKMSAPWAAMPINQQSPQDAYLSVLDKAGCNFPKRDKVDTDIIYDTRTGTTKYGKNGIISKPSDVGGWPVLNSLPAPTDTDHDGMPDAWESSHGLNPAVADHNGDRDKDGYTNIEEYLGCLVGEFTTCGGGVSVNVAPTVNITSPVNNATFNAPATITINANAADSDGTISKVEFYNGTTLLGSSVNSPYSYSWTNVVAGTYTLTAKATDNKGASTTSTAITVVVSAQAADCNGDVNGTAKLDACGVCTGGKSIYKACVGSIEAETACTLDGSIDNNNAGFTGTGFINVNNAIGTKATWYLKSSSAQTATLTFRYANGGTTSRDASIKINGNSTGNLVLAPTGSWTTWKTASVNLTLMNGSNQIVLTSTTADGFANIDLISFSAGVSETACVVTGVEDSEFSDFQIFPNPTTSSVTISQEVDWELYSSQGELIEKSRSEKINLESLPSGLYFVKINSQNIKLIKQ